jgi:hypothetical protein
MRTPGAATVAPAATSSPEFPVRPTNDADTVIDVRADLTMLATSTKT